ncbi:MAG: flavin reductase [Bacteroidia bacterium]|nr:flavin reductase [Bacteroidia bacterium]
MSPAPGQSKFMSHNNKLLSEQLRRTMRLWASGVVVVSTAYKEQRAGMTVSSFTSVTIDPPVILVCLNKSAYTLKLIRRSRIFAVSVLGEEHKEISQHFARQTPTNVEDRFDNMHAHTVITGAPILTESIGWLDCEVMNIREMGTHYIVGGKVLATEQREDAGRPLLYYDQNYRRIIDDPH